MVSKAPFSIETKGGVVNAQVLENGALVKVEMGIVSFASSKIPVLGESRDVLLETLNLDGKQIVYSAATIGNPHCVVMNENPSESLAREIGSQLEIHPNFPHRTNVQFMKILNRNRIQIEIWERGAGYTLASGSSSCASAAVARKLGLCEKNIIVSMPGGNINIEVNENFSVTMSGAVTAICNGEISLECLSQII